MADVSVRFQVAGDAEVVLNLSMPQAVRLMEAIARKVEGICAPLRRRVHAVVNYEGFVLGRDVEDAWADTVSEIVARWYDGVTRYTTSAFLRAKLGEALAKRRLAPHIFESEEEALAALPASSSAKIRHATAPDAR